MHSVFARLPDNYPPPFDAKRAQRTLEALPGKAAAALREPKIARLLEHASGNSGFLAGLMEREPDFLEEFFRQGPDAVLERLNAEALNAAAEPDHAVLS